MTASVNSGINRGDLKACPPNLFANVAQKILCSSDACGRSLLFIDTLHWLVFDFSFSLLHALPQTNAKEKKTTDRNGCFNSYEMGSLLQDSIGKELTIPSFQMQTNDILSSVSDSYIFPLNFLQSKTGP
jgi:hypothetical protein